MYVYMYNYAKLTIKLYSILYRLIIPPLMTHVYLPTKRSIKAGQYLF